MHIIARRCAIAEDVNVAEDVTVAEDVAVAEDVLRSAPRRISERHKFPSHDRSAKL